VDEGDAMSLTPILASAFSDAFDFIFHQRESVAGTVRVGGLHEIGTLTAKHLELSLAAVGAAALVSIPLALWLGHIGRAQFIAVSISNVGRAVPAIALIAFFIAFLGVGFVNVGAALCLLAIPPIVTNTYVGVRGVDPVTIDAARGMGLNGWQIVRRVELPLALPTIWGGVRISLVSVIATATIAPYASVNTLGLPIINEQIYGSAGRLGACIVIAALTLAADGILVAVERLSTPKGVLLARRRAAGARRRILFRPSPITTRSAEAS
jgi:osmoprotectant transport system permease protein